jgi:protein-disulfide isomerase
MPNETATSKRQQLRDKRAREQQRGRLMMIGGIAIFAILLVAFVVIPMLKPVDLATIEPFERPQADFNATGDPDAPITITEYSDFQCPYCKRFADQTERQLVDAYVATGTVRFVYRSFGSFIGAESGDSAEAAYCAGDQGQFWQFHDFLFANHTGENVGDYTTRKLEAMAEALNLDMNAFTSCTSSGKYAEQILQDSKDGIAAGIQATPSFIISYVVNGETRTRVIEGAQPFGQFQAEIEAALAEIAAAQ